MLHYPNIDPVALHLGPLAIHWYGIMYLLGFFLAWRLLVYRVKKTGLMTPDQVSDLIFYGALGVIVGGRFGYMFFYNLPVFLHAPWQVFMIWDGGMSFHGGMLGVLAMMWWYSKKLSLSFFCLTDFMAPVVPLGLGAGRLGNFINGELWGRVTDVSWGMVYPAVDAQPRHPSELYEFLLEGVLLFIVLWWYSKKARPKMAVSGLFLLGYGGVRIFCECFRAPDPQYGYLAWDWLTMGQLLSLPMVLIGLILLVCAYRSSRR
jgi:phosphatidylglycerol:prolipoprotein diacylglycerol transferase